jgi:putative nucleotidyltransferase with HDIG domain
MSAELALLGGILRDCEDPDLSLGEFAERVARSPQLASEIVRVANSALYGMEGRIKRLDRAVLMLGQRPVASIATGVLVARRSRSLAIGPIRGDALWLHSLETAICAELIARCLDLADPGEAYLAGLIHDMGIPELGEAHGESYARVLERAAREELPLEALEREALGDSHAARLAELAGEWGFPEGIRAAIAAHHAPLEAQEGSRSLASLIAASHALLAEDPAGWIEPGADLEAGPVLEKLGLLPDDVVEIRELTAEKLQQSADVFG